MSLIYIETSIPSFYFETRTDPENAARQNWTRRWFDKAILEHEVVTSAAVVVELERGEFHGRKEAIAMVSELAALVISEETYEIVDEYVRRKLMPRDVGGDALHLAIASQYSCDVLATWNCRHLANANKFGHIHRVNDMLGLSTPTLTTPLELLEGDDDHESISRPRS